MVISAPMNAARRERKLIRQRALEPRTRGLAFDLVTEGMVARELRVDARSVVFVKGIIEASEGTCALVAERHGRLMLMSPPDRVRELEELIQDLESELGPVVAVSNDQDVALA